MNNGLELIIKITNAEYNGHSFNGPSLVKTLEKMSLEQVKSTDTYENYSTWSIALHCMYFKYKTLKFINPDSPMTFNYEHTSFPSIPGNGSQKAWDQTLTEMTEIHNAYIDELKKLPKEKLQDPIEEWECNIEAAIIWMSTHDAYHTAQIRNMGVKNL